MLTPDQATELVLQWGGVLLLAALIIGIAIDFIKDKD